MSHTAIVSLLDSIQSVQEFSPMNLLEGREKEGEGKEEKGKEGGERMREREKRRELAN